MKRWTGLLTVFILLPGLSGAANENKAKSSYLKKANHELQVWNVKVDELRKRSEEAGARTRAEFDQALNSTRKNLDVSRQKVTEVENSGQDSWKSLSRGVDEAFRKVREAYREAITYLENDKPKEKS